MPNFKVHVAYHYVEAIDYTLEAPTEEAAISEALVLADKDLIDPELVRRVATITAVSQTFGAKPVTPET